MLFSQRRGLKSIKNVIQIDSIDQDLRNALWSAVTIWRNQQNNSLNIEHFEDLMTRFWLFYLKSALDTFPGGTHLFSRVRNLFFDGEWNECYDILEFIVANYPD